MRTHPRGGNRRCTFDRAGFLNISQPWLEPTRADIERARVQAVNVAVAAIILAVCGWVAFAIVIVMR